MWENLISSTTDTQPRDVWRLVVPGGWLYLAAAYGVSDLAYVPQPAEQGDKVKPSSQVELNHAFREGYRNALKAAMSGLSGEEKRFVQAEYERADCDLPHPFIEQGDKIKPSDLAALLERAATALLDERARR